MASTMERLSSNKVRFTINVAAEKFDEGLNIAYRKLVKRINIPGFRRGKAPMRVIENYYGPSVFYEDALEAVFPEAYSEAVKEAGVTVVDQPSIDVTQIGRGQELIFTAEVFVSPEVTLGEYKNLGIEKAPIDVTDDDVDAEIDRVRDRNSRWEEVTDRPAKLDDQVNLDYEGYCDGEQFDGGTATGSDLVLGSGTFIPGFEEALVGATVGQELDVNVTFPEDYSSKDLAGKPATFKCKINSIRVKELPALDEDFVKDVSENANTVEEYKAEIRDRLVKAAEDRADAAFENEIIEAITEKAEIDIPDAMIEDALDDVMRDMQLQMAYSGMRMEDFYKYTNQTEAQVRSMYKPQAEQRVRNRLVLEAIRKAENIEATDEEVEAEIAKYAEQSRRTVEEFKKTLNDTAMQNFRDAASIQKTVDFLKANAK